MRRVLVMFGVMSLGVGFGLGCNSSDDPGGTPCGTSGDCPMGYECDPGIRRCILLGHGGDGGSPDGMIAADAPPTAPADAATPTPDAASPTPDARPPVDAAPAPQPDAALVAPDTVIESKPLDPTSDTTATFTFTSVPAGATFECALGKPYAFSACTSPKEYPGLADGRYDFAVRARSGAAVDPTPAEHSFTVDATGPMVTLSGPGEGSTTGRSVSYTYTAEAGATFFCALDSLALASCPTSGRSYTIDTGGEHVFRVRAEDGLGNSGDTVVRTFIVDATGPMVNIDPFASDESGRDGTVTYSATETATFQCKLAPASSFTSCPATGYDFASLDGGPHMITVRATDAYGNTGPEESYSWTVTGPVTVLVTHFDAPLAGATVVFHDETGAVVGETTTASDGTASGDVPPGGMVTAAYLNSSVYYLYTATDVQPFDNVHLGRFPFSESYTLHVQTTLPAAPAGAYVYKQEVGDGLGWLSYTYPNMLNLNVTERCRDSGGKINVLASVENDSGVPIAYGWETGISVPANGSTTATIDGWLAPIDRSVTVSGVPGDATSLNAEGGIVYNGQSYRDNAYASIATPPASNVLAFKRPPTSVGQGAWVNARVYRPAGEQKIISTASTIDFGGALPTVSGMALDRSVATRPRANWTMPGGLSSADGMLTFIMWGVTPEDPAETHWWFIVTPPVASVQVPALPASLAAWEPGAGNTIILQRHQSFESTAFANGSDFREGWIQLSREGLVQISQRSPPVFGTSFTTKITQTYPP